MSEDNVHMNYEIKNFTELYGIEGISEQTIDNHLTLYEGYVKNVNILMQVARQSEKGSAQYNEVKRRLGFEWDGMRMHEIFFSNLSKDAKSLNKDGNFLRAIVDNFGSYEEWLEDFTALGALRGNGWVSLVRDDKDGRLLNIWIGEHHVGQLCDVSILLTVDVWEHAYMIDYGSKKGEYIRAVMSSINWEEVEKRFNK